MNNLFKTLFIFTIFMRFTEQIGFFYIFLTFITIFNYITNVYVYYTLILF